VSCRSREKAPVIRFRCICFHPSYASRRHRSDGTVRIVAVFGGARFRRPANLLPSVRSYGRSTRITQRKGDQDDRCRVARSPAEVHQVNGSRSRIHRDS
jgi:hypothetical protein